MLLLWGPFQQSTHQVFFMLHKIIVCCLVVVALAFPARASSLWHPEPGFLPEDARHAVPNNPAPPERTVPEQVLPPLPVQDEGTIRRVATKEKVAALTFDLCELSTMTTGYDAEIIDFLREKRTRPPCSWAASGCGPTASGPCSYGRSFFLRSQSRVVAWQFRHYERKGHVGADPLDAGGI